MQTEGMPALDAVVWGASGGIGTALVERLKEANWRVFGVARDARKIPSAADMAISFEAGDEHSFEVAAYAIASESSGVDLAVYAAGGLRAARLGDLSLDRWADVMSSNLTGAYLAARHGLGLMRPDGHMVFIGAYVDHLILPKMGAYAAAKAGLEPLVAVLRKENRTMRFTIVRPGAVDTAFWDNAPFRKPGNAKSPGAVSQAILDHHLTGDGGDLNL
jgi:NAD(P)-dependent dehydrogenase (short-subunit alcohol dehydrogenase family)